MRLTLIFFIAIVISLIITSCKKDSYLSNAVIIGWDVKTCVCCGGLLIKINDQLKTYLIGNDPPGLNIKYNGSFPIYVKIDWQIDSLHCFGNYILINRIKRLP